MIRAAVLALAFLIAPKAMAHELFSDMKDPKMGSCCDGNDCDWFKPLPGEIEVIEGQGVKVRMTGERARQMNPATRLTHIDQLFPEWRILPSPTGEWGICPKYAGQPDDAIRCLVKPDSGS